MRFHVDNLAAFMFERQKRQKVYQSFVRNSWPFNFDMYPAEKFLQKLRFAKRDVEKLYRLLNIPETLVLGNKMKINGTQIKIGLLPA